MVKHSETLSNQNVNTHLTNRDIFIRNNDFRVP